jgi:hypothetical protein
MRTDQCWIWLGSRNTKGYGEISVGNKNVMVHRLAYTENVGEIPNGLVIDHLCHDPRVCAGGTCAHRLCVNPAHLQAVTNAENLRRQSPALKTECVRGHERTTENTAVGKDGHKYCIPCRREYLRTYQRPSRARAVRAWARENGIEIGVRGRIGAAVLDAYTAAQSKAA